MRVLRMAVPVVLVVATAAVVGPAGAEEPNSFTACVRVERGGECLESTNVLYGSTVYVIGKVDPPYADRQAVVLHRAPGDTEWERLATVEITQHGGMRYRWETSLDDADVEHPNLLKFKIPGIGSSQRVEVLVFAGE